MLFDAAIQSQGLKMDAREISIRLPFLFVYLLNALSLPEKECELTERR
jgi:hypothetical protein